MQTHMIEMRDGIRLATDIHLPPSAAAGDRFPVIIERTPYGRADISGSEISVDRDTPLRRDQLAKIMAERGYAVVMQDVRGRGGSDGRFDKYVNEAEDGVDTLDWLLKQDFCDGRICTMGLSYGAHTQLAAAVGGARGIAAMCIDTGGLMDLWRHSLRLGGGFELKQLTWAFRHAERALRAAGKDAEADRIAATNIRDAIINADWRTGCSPLAEAPEYEATLLRMWNLREDDPTLNLPATRAAGFMDQMPDVPVLLTGSWFDPYATNMMELASAIRAHNRAPMRQIMGPWLHGRRSTGKVGDADFGPRATIEAATGRDWITLRLDWFDFALDRGPEPLTSDLFYEMSCGTGWPHMSGEWRDHMRASCPLPIRMAEPARLSFEPQHPFPTLGGGVTSGGMLMTGGMFDHQSSKDVAGAVTFSSGVLKQPVLLSGPIGIDIIVSDIDSRGPIDISINLLMRCEDGAIINITDGFLRLAAGKISGTIRLLSTFFHVPAGAELLLVLATANFPRIDFGRAEPYEIGLHLSPTSDELVLERQIFG